MPTIAPTLSLVFSDASALARVVFDADFVAAFDASSFEGGLYTGFLSAILFSLRWCAEGSSRLRLFLKDETVVYELAMSRV
jgi:hypothetical protein